MFYCKLKKVLIRNEGIDTNSKEQLLSVIELIIWYAMDLEKVTTKRILQLLIFIRECNSKIEFIEEFFQMESLKEMLYLKRIKNCLTTDGAPSLTGKYVGTLKKFRLKFAKIILITIMLQFIVTIHQQILCKNVIKVEQSCIIKLVNLILNLSTQNFFLILEFDGLG